MTSQFHRFIGQSVMRVVSREKWSNVYSIQGQRRPRLIRIITKICLYNFDPLKSHFYRVKLGFTGVYIIILIFARKHRLWVLVRTASVLVLVKTDSNEYPQSMFWAEIWKKYQSFLSEKISDFGGENFSIYLNRRVFVMISSFDQGLRCTLIESVTTTKYYRQT